VRQTDSFVARLSDPNIVGPAELALLRQLAGQRLDERVEGFDLFAGVWWPLRQKSRASPRREVAWLIAKLYAAASLPHVRRANGPGPRLAEVVGRCEPLERRARERYRRRFDSLLQTPLSAIETHVAWALGVAHDAVGRARIQGLDWVALTDDLSIWDRANEHRRRVDIRDQWAKDYFGAMPNPKKGANDAD